MSSVIYISSLLASLHYLALPLGLGAVFIRGRGFRNLETEWTPKHLHTVFTADTLWGIAALLWIATGLLRAFGGFEKGTNYYLSSTLFWVKMGLFLLVLILEIRPMVTLIRWRIAQKRSLEAPPPGTLAALHRLNSFEISVVVVMVFVASVMGRGLGF